MDNTAAPTPANTLETKLQSIVPIPKKEVPKIEVQQQRVEAPKPNFAPVPMSAAPIGQ